MPSLKLPKKDIDKRAEWVQWRPLRPLTRTRAHEYQEGWKHLACLFWRKEDQVTAIFKCAVDGHRVQGPRLLQYAPWKYERQWTKVAGGQIPDNYNGKNVTMSMAKYWKKIPREAVKSWTLRILRPWLDKITQQLTFSVEANFKVDPA